jgi:hypothetical protein
MQMQLRLKHTIIVVLLSLLIISTPLVSAQTLELIEWHECVKKNAIFAWKVTSVDLSDEDMANFLDGLLIQMKIIRNPPSDPSRFFNATEAPDWVYVYINGFKIELEQMGGMATAFTQLVSPTIYHFDNGTSFTLEEIYRLAGSTGEFDIYYTVEGGYLNTTMGNSTMRMTTFTNIDTGIALNISMLMEEMGSFTLEYYVQAANVNDKGESTEIEEDYTDFQENPLTTLRNQILTTAVFIVVAILLAVYFRKKS